MSDVDTIRLLNLRRRIRQRLDERRDAEVVALLDEMDAITDRLLFGPQWK